MRIGASLRATSHEFGSSPCSFGLRRKLRLRFGRYDKGKENPLGYQSPVSTELIEHHRNQHEDRVRASFVHGRLRISEPTALGALARILDPVGRIDHDQLLYSVAERGRIGARSESRTTGHDQSAHRRTSEVSIERQLSPQNRNRPWTKLDDPVLVCFGGVPINSRRTRDLVTERVLLTLS